MKCFTEAPDCLLLWQPGPLNHGTQNGVQSSENQSELDSAKAYLQGSAKAL